MERFTVNNDNRKGLLFVNVYGAREFLIYNDKTGVALLSQAGINPSGTDTAQLETAKKKELYTKLDQLINRDYKVYATFDHKGCKFVKFGKELEKIMIELSK